MTGKLGILRGRWKYFENWRSGGTKARSQGAGFKLFYHGVDGMKHGVGAILGDAVRNVLGVKRVSE